MQLVTFLYDVQIKYLELYMRCLLITILDNDTVINQIEFFLVKKIREKLNYQIR